MSFTIYFSHGKDSGPDGYKIRYLKQIATEMNIKSVSLDYSFTKDPELRVDYLLKTYNKNEKNVILYGSSMGAYVSTVASEIIRPKALFLCAPAFYLEGYKVQSYKNLNCPVTIIHGKNDTVVPFKNSERFAKNIRCDLHIVNDGHTLSGSEIIISNVFKAFLKKVVS